MSFSYFKRKVKNENLSIWIRLAALRSCIRILSVNQGAKYPDVLLKYNEKFKFDRYKGTDSEPPSGETLLKVLIEVEEERNQILSSNLGEK